MAEHPHPQMDPNVLAEIIWQTETSKPNKAKNDYYYNPFNQRSDKELSKRIFLIRQFFLSKMTVKDKNYKAEKNQVPPIAPNIWWYSRQI